MNVARALATTVVLYATAGCALTSKSDPLSPHYYSPETYEVSASSRETIVKSERAMPALRLGRVTASSHLGERVVYRDSSHEIGYYEDRRWSERPDVYLRRALSRRLFEQKGMRRLVAGAGPTLDVELIDFEELRGTSPTARVRASFILQDGRAVLREQTIVVERAIAVEKQPTAEQMVVALSAALDELVERMTTSVQAGLEQPASANEKAPTIK